MLNMAAKKKEEENRAAPDIVLREKTAVLEESVTIADEAFAWADSGRANCILFRLVDSGHIDIASYALKFLTS